MTSEASMAQALVAQNHNRSKSHEQWLTVANPRATYTNRNTACTRLDQEAAKPARESPPRQEPDVLIICFFGWSSHKASTYCLAAGPPRHPAQIPPRLRVQVGASPALSGSAPWVAPASTCSQITRELSDSARRKNPAGAMRCFARETSKKLRRALSVLSSDPSISLEARRILVRE